MKKIAEEAQKKDKQELNYRGKVSNVFDGYKLIKAYFEWG